MTTPGKPAFGGTVLRIPAIQSPNYVPGVSGWAIFQNGTVEFNSGTFRGTVTAGTFRGTDFVINSDGEFFYNGAPASGNLVKSSASLPGTDQFGNAYLASDVSYSPSGSPREAAQLSASGLITYTAPTAAGPWSQTSAVTWATGLSVDDVSLNGIFIGTAFGVPVTIGKAGQLVTLDGQVTATGGSQASPTLITTDTDHAITSFSNGWGNNGVCRAAVIPIGFTGKNMVYVEVNMTAGTLANGTTMFTLPAGIPAPTVASTFFDLGTQGGTAITNGPYCQITTGGNGQCFSLPAGTTSVRGWKIYPAS